MLWPICLYIKSLAVKPMVLRACKTNPEVRKGRLEGLVALMIEYIARLRSMHDHLMRSHICTTVDFALDSA